MAKQRFEAAEASIQMPYEITFEPLNPIRGVTPKTVTKETAKEAWKLVDGLMRSDERVTAINPGQMGWEELRMLAEKEGQK